MLKMLKDFMISKPTMLYGFFQKEICGRHYADEEHDLHFIVELLILNNIP